ncbi:MAG TPA: hypothetical protein DDZ40_07320 [Deltaproteobacteria bacterium]|nr:hypothetical protein [Deltaproteobacteria bacterium]
MEVDAIVTEVGGIVQDATYDETWIIGKFNEALTLVATLCRIPGLQTTAPVEAAIAAITAALPKTYLHDLYLVTTPTYPQGILIAPNIKELKTNSNDTQTGPVQIICLDGKILNFRPIPAATENMTLHFYGKPKELAAGDVFPDYIPEILHKEIFQNYALKEAYLQIEDGLDGVMPNTQKYGGLAANGIAALIAFYPNAPKARANVQRTRLDF